MVAVQLFYISIRNNVQVSCLTGVPLASAFRPLLQVC
jgi:hypothetical protein